MNSRELASNIIDISADSEFVQDFEVDIQENIILEARMELEEGFVDIFKNFDTGKTAFAWIIDNKRVYGADNTGGWHTHPFSDPETHRSCEEINLEEFMERVGELIQEL